MARVIAVWTEYHPEPYYEHGIFWYCGEPCPKHGDFMQSLEHRSGLHGLAITNGDYKMVARAIRNQLQKDYPLSTVVEQVTLK